MSKVQTNLLRICLISLVSANNAFAYDVKLLKKNDIAPYPGFLFTLDSAKSLSLELEDYDKEKEINLSLTTSVNLYKQNEATFKQEIDQLQAQNSDQLKAIQAAESNSFWVKAMWFGIGALTVGLGAYATAHH